MVQSLTAAPLGLRANPRSGERLEEFDSRGVRRIIVGDHEIRYKIQDNIIYMLANGRLLYASMVVFASKLAYMTEVGSCRLTKAIG